MTFVDTPLDRDQLVVVVARDIPRGAFVHLGIGLPTKVSNHLTPEDGVILHTENGLLGMGPEAVGEQVDPDLVNAGKIPVTALAGASYFHHADSFAMMRGGHLDICVLGAYQVSASGDLANPAAANSESRWIAERSRFTLARSNTLGTTTSTQPPTQPPPSLRLKRAPVNDLASDGVEQLTPATGAGVRKVAGSTPLEVGR